MRSSDHPGGFVKHEIVAIIEGHRDIKATLTSRDRPT